MKEECKKKSKKRLFITLSVIVVLLIGIVMCCFGDSLINFVSSDKKEGEKAKFTEKDAIELLDTVPFMTNLPYKELDAYQEEQVTIFGIDSKSLLLNVYYELGGKDKLLPYVQGMPRFSIDEKKVSTSDSLYLKTSDVEKYVYETYNFDNLKHQNFNVPGGFAQYIGNYYGFYFDSGSFKYEKLSKLLEYKEEDEQLIIIEKFGVVTDWDSPSNKYILNKHVSSDIIGESMTVEDATKLIEKDSITVLSSSEDPKNYFENNIDKFSTYKHIFSKVSDKYYWYSTQLYDANEEQNNLGF